MILRILIKATNQYPLCIKKQENNYQKIKLESNDLYYRLFYYNKTIVINLGKSVTWYIYS